MDSGHNINASYADFLTLFSVNDYSLLSKVTGIPVAHQILLTKIANTNCLRLDRRSKEIGEIEHRSYSSLGHRDEDLKNIKLDLSTE